jgi:Holliday junction resolvasome RuvABC endonuclease subunit
MTLVAALDLGTVCGVAIGAPKGKPDWHTVRLGNGEPRERFGQVFRLVSDLVAQRGVTEIVIEAPLIIANRVASTDALRFLVGATGVAHAAAHIAGVPSGEIAVATVRKHFLGYAPRGRDVAKKAVIDRCKLLGWAADTADAADALALLDCRLAQLSAHHVAQRPARMFTRQA